MIARVFTRMIDRGAPPVVLARKVEPTMVRILIRAAVFLATAALGLLAAALILPDFRLSASGFVVAVAVFALAQSVLAPFILNLARKYAPALLGGIGLVATFVALLIASFFPGGLSITGASTWVLATLIVWIVTALGAWLLPLFLLKERRQQSKGTPSRSS